MRNLDLELPFHKTKVDYAIYQGANCLQSQNNEWKCNRMPIRFRDCQDQQIQGQDLTPHCRVHFVVTPRQTSSYWIKLAIQQNIKGTKIGGVSVGTLLDYLCIRSLKKNGYGPFLEVLDAIQTASFKSPKGILTVVKLCNVVHEH